MPVKPLSPTNRLVIENVISKGIDALRKENTKALSFSEFTKASLSEFKTENKPLIDRFERIIKEKPGKATPVITDVFTKKGVNIAYHKDQYMIRELSSALNIL